MFDQDAERIKELQQKLTTHDLERCEFLDTISSLQYDQAELKEQVRVRDDQIRSSEVKLHAVLARSEELAEQLKMKEAEEELLLTKEREEAHEAQIKQTRVIRSLKLQAKCVLSCVTRRHHFLLQRFRRMKHLHQKLIEQLVTRNDQLRRLSQVLWDTGWDYTRTKYELAKLSEIASLQKSSQTIGWENEMSEPVG
ncbi:unnamed protein product [Echinostoma caproni]|uniref:Uncharacterized protein n=1 Tax=Echinostoma caproni TaxID=27848 RepID=A0A3P8GS97_9TREM|nr:unnamed protein product [Echinostoma caproni]